MPELWLGIVSALWLGIMTSISPCPLSTNIAAVAYISREIERPGRVFVNGLLYTLGRVLVYVVLAAALTQGLLVMHEASHVLQKYVIRAVGPLLIVIGLIVLDLIRFNLPGGDLGAKLQERFQSPGLIGSVLLGGVFALSFCPISAAMFFGGLLPLTAERGSVTLLPLMYGVGTAVPVIGFSLLVAFGSRAVGTVFNHLTAVEIWMRRVVGAVFLLLGIYLTLTHTLRLWT